MPILKKSEISHLKGLMDGRYAKLVGEVREELVRSGDQQYIDLAGSVNDFGDVSVADMLMDINIAMIDRQVHELREIEVALRRMEQSNYGHCSDCGGDIGYDRLKIQPATTRCVRCQKHHEKTYAREPTSSL